MAVIDRYEQEADAFITLYESLSFEFVHASLVDLLPASGATVLDVGAGSGRDAAWLAARGYSVVAVEPSEAMRSRAIKLHGSHKIRWIPDSLPELTQVRRLGLSYDLILLSAVWMHVPAHLRERCLRNLATVMAPTGKMAISLRIGAPDPARNMHAVSMTELSKLTRQLGLRIIATDNSGDQLGRVGITWITVVIG